MRTIIIKIFIILFITIPFLGNGQNSILVLRDTTNESQNAELFNNEIKSALRNLRDQEGGRKFGEVIFDRSLERKNAIERSVVNSIRESIFQKKIEITDVDSVKINQYDSGFTGKIGYIMSYKVLEPNLGYNIAPEFYTYSHPNLEEMDPVSSIFIPKDSLGRKNYMEEKFRKSFLKLFPEATEPVQGRKRKRTLRNLTVGISGAVSQLSGLIAGIFYMNSKNIYSDYSNTTDIETFTELFPEYGSREAALTKANKRLDISRDLTYIYAGAGLISGIVAIATKEDKKDGNTDLLINGSNIGLTLNF